MPHPEGTSASPQLREGVHTGVYRCVNGSVAGECIWRLRMCSSAQAAHILLTQHNPDMYQAISLLKPPLLSVPHYTTRVHIIPLILTFASIGKHNTMHDTYYLDKGKR